MASRLGLSKGSSKPSSAYDIVLRTLLQLFYSKTVSNVPKSVQLVKRVTMTSNFFDTIRHIRHHLNFDNYSTSLIAIMNNRITHDERRENVSHAVLAT